MIDFGFAQNQAIADFDHVIDLLNKRGEVVDEMRRELDIQFKRIAQLQLDVDRLRERQ